MKINGSLSLPVLEIQHLKGDLCVTAFASDVVRKGGLCVTQRLVFRNASSAIAKVGMHIKKPFNVISLRTCGMKKEDSTVAAVLPGECVEVSAYNICRFYSFLDI